MMINMCSCAACSEENGEPFGIRMILCSECGKKRCPHATDHRLVCTKSNDPGQAGSSYGYPLPSQIKMHQSDTSPAHRLFHVLMAIQKKFPEHQHKATTLSDDAYLKILEKLMAE